MRPIYQTRFGRDGNCLAACFASILEAPIAKVDFSCSETFDPTDWYWLALDKLAPLGWAYLSTRAGRNKDGELELSLPNGAYFIATGSTSRGPLHHAVVCEVANRRWKFVHDPHPEGEGLERIYGVGFLVPSWIYLRASDPRVIQPHSQAPGGAVIAASETSES